MITHSPSKVTSAMCLKYVDCKLKIDTDRQCYLNIRIYGILILHIFLVLINKIKFFSCIGNIVTLHVDFSLNCCQNLDRYHISLFFCVKSAKKIVKKLFVKNIPNHLNTNKSNQAVRLEKRTSR